MKKLIFTGFLILAVSLWTAPTASAYWNNALNPVAGGQTPLAGSAIPKYVDPLPLLDIQTGPMETVVQSLSTPGPFNIYMHEFPARVLSSTFVAPPGGNYPNYTMVWGYRTSVNPPTATQGTYIGPVFVVPRGSPTEIKFWNKLGTAASTQVLAWKYSTDQTMHWADPLGLEANACAEDVALGNVNGLPYPPFNDPCARNYGEGVDGTFSGGPIPAVVHLHGGEVPPELDGGPDAWVTSDGLKWGHGYYTKGGIQGSNPNPSGEKNTFTYRYPNTQEPANIWFHDHVLGITRLNVYAGLAGAYIIWDPAITPAFGGPFPGGTCTANCLPADLGNVSKIIPIVIQDRMFDTNGQLFFPADSAGGLLWTTNPEHPYWVPEFVGDAIVVNGKTWPYLNVDQGRYRFLFINGSNARTYELFLPNPITGLNLPLYVISNDGGYLDAPVPVNKLVIMPGERYDVIIDFSAVTTVPTNLVLKNTGRTPFPKGAPPNGATVGQIMQFRVGGTPVNVTQVTYDPAGLAPTIRSSAIGSTLPPAIVRLTTNGSLPAGATYRQLTLNEVMGMPVTVQDPVVPLNPNDLTQGGLLTPYPGGPLEVILNNTKWSGKRVVNNGTVAAPVLAIKEIDGGPPWIQVPATGPAPPAGQIWYSERPFEGTTEVWEIVNITADAHPIHLHLVQFQIISRQNFNVGNYMKAYNLAFQNQAPIKGCWDVVANAYYPAGVFQPACGPPLPYAPSAATGMKYGGNPDVYALSKGKPLYMQGKAYPPAVEEAGWKDTVVSYPGQVLRLAVRWAPMDLPVTTPAASAYFPFSPNGHGYVWHCHIIDHEDNEMMRPTQVQPLVVASGTVWSGTATTLIDVTSANFTEALVGFRVNNLSDDSTGVITAINNPTQLTIGGGMSGGNTLDPDESYQIVPNRTYVKGIHY